MYGRTTFNEVYNIYLAYHRTIHQLLLAMKREAIDDTARQESSFQDNTTFRVIGECIDPPAEPDVR
jgi:hypothetical protein